MTLRNRHPTLYPLLCVVFVVMVALGALLTAAWMQPGYVECQGFLESENWLPVYSPGDGVVRHGVLEDGKTVEKGETLITLDDRWMAQNLKNVRQELNTRELEMKYLERNRNLFLDHRKIEEAELLRLVEADRKLLENGSLTRNELEHTRYLYRSFVAGAEREDSEMKLALDQVRLNICGLQMQEDYWILEIEETRLIAPVSGTYFSLDAVHGNGGTPMIPEIGPGWALETGQLLGYLIPGDAMRARVEIPQHKIGECRTGQTVLVVPAARSSWRNPPLTGRLRSVMPVAAGGCFSAVVELTVSGETMEEIRSLSCGSLTARIDVRGRDANPGGLWIRWMTEVNSWKNRGRPGKDILMDTM